MNKQDQPDIDLRHLSRQLRRHLKVLPICLLIATATMALLNLGSGNGDVPIGSQTRTSVYYLRLSSQADGLRPFGEFIEGIPNLTTLSRILSFPTSFKTILSGATNREIQISLYDAPDKILRVELRSSRPGEDIAKITKEIIDRYGSSLLESIDQASIVLTNKSQNISNSANGTHNRIVDQNLLTFLKNNLDVKAERIEIDDSIVASDIAITTKTASSKFDLMSVVFGIIFGAVLWFLVVFLSIILTRKIRSAFDLGDLVSINEVLSIREPDKGDLYVEQLLGVFHSWKNQYRSIKVIGLSPSTELTAAVDLISRAISANKHDLEFAHQPAGWQLSNFLSEDSEALILVISPEVNSKNDLQLLRNYLTISSMRIVQVLIV